MARIHPTSAQKLWACVRAEWEPETWPILRRAGFGPEVDKIKSLHAHHIVHASFDAALAELRDARVFDRPVLPPRTLATTPVAMLSKQVLAGHEGSEHTATVLPDGRIVTISEARVRVWSEQGGTWTPTVLEGHTGQVLGTAVLPNGRLVTVSEDKTCVWREHEGAWTPTVLKGDGRSVAALPDGRFVTACSIGTSSRVWREHHGTWTFAELKGTDLNFRHVAVLPDCRPVTACNGEGAARVWREQNGAWICAELKGGHTASLWGMLVLQDGRLVNFAHAGRAPPCSRDTRLTLAKLMSNRRWFQSRHGCPP